ncbi:hypothetical protein INT43_004194 [Umbelopsis isabellina]|uniref:Late endosomal/lysosomal adaptor and MAPK and MTOR activator 1 n=1 Tax=Mortierella isabellina TaxID=91625 RepID=A0A8H7UC60_MORIS|nr:hypothetical protein INT43_004194 [Umbelopsis isabellina]
MGSCCSKQSHDSEREPLLPGADGSNHGAVGNQPSIPYPPAPAIDYHKEQEFWNTVVERTEQQLIDISSAQTDLLQNQDAQERSEKYQDIISQIQNDIPWSNVVGPNIPKGQLSSSAACDSLLNAAPNGGLGEEQMNWLYQAMDDIQDAVANINVRPVGEIVVNLNFSDNAIA